MKSHDTSKLQIVTLLICFSFSLTFAQSSDSLSLAHFDLDACAANQGLDEQYDYSEFTANIDNSGACADLTITTGHLSVGDPDSYGHSCTPGVDGDRAMCVSANPNCADTPGANRAIKFSVRIEPSETGIAVLSNLSFYEQAPPIYTWINSPSGTNNYPTLFNVRVFLGGNLVYMSGPTPTQQQWNLRSFDFSEIPAFTVTEPTTFDFEMLAFCPVGNGAPVYAWDLDELTVSTDCCLILEGGELSGGPFEFCVGDGEEDHVSGVTLSGNIGSQSQYVVTDEDGTILGLPPTPEAVDFDGAGAGTCLIWHVSYFGTLGGLEMGNNLNSDLAGDCYKLSNPVTVVRNQVPEGGMLTGGPFEFCVGDGVSDHVSGIELTGATGTNGQFVVTDEAGAILGLPPTAEQVDFDGAGPGTCLIWHLTFDSDVTGLEMGNNLMEDVSGCFGLSNPVTVVRNSQPEGGELSGGPFEFCVGDSIADHVTGVELTGNTGANSQYVVTDTAFVILGLPPSPEAVDFDGAGAGTCLIWHISSEGTVSGLELGNSLVTDVNGCIGFSNFITVIRNQPDGGTLTGGPYEFCIDSLPDFVDSLELTGNVGSSQYVITDTLGTILGLPPSPDSVDFNAADTGVCLIWHVSFAGDTLVGAALDSNVSDLQGCFSISNSITVTRNAGPCEDSIGGGPVLDMNLFPNPVEDVLTLEFENGGGDWVTVQVIDMNGRICWVDKCDPRTSAAIDLGDLPDGHYFVRARGMHGVRIRSVVLLR